MSPTLILSPALAVVLPQPLDRILTDLRASCGTMPIGPLTDAVDALIEQLEDAEAEHLLIVARPFYRTIDSNAWTPSAHLFALECRYQPCEDDRPSCEIESSFEERAWDRAVYEAQLRAEREWRDDMGNMLLATRTAVTL